MFKFLRKKTAKATAEVSKIQNRDLMEAICAGAVLVGYADGNLSKEEQQKLEGIICTNKSLEHFGTEISKTLDNYALMFEAGVRTARHKLMKEITDLNGDEEQKVEAYLIMIDIADADGNIDEEEYKVLQSIGKALGLNPDNYI